MKDGILIEIDGCRNCPFYSYEDLNGQNCSVWHSLDEFEQDLSNDNPQKHPTNCPLLKTEVTVRLMEDNNNIPKEPEQTVEQKLAKHLFDKQVSNTYQVGESVKFIKDNYNLIPKK